MRNAYKILVGKPEGKRPVGRPRRGWEDNIRMEVTKMVGRCGMDSAGSGQGSASGICEHGNEPSGSIKGGECRDSLSDYQLLKKYCVPWIRLKWRLLPSTTQAVTSLTEFREDHLRPR